MEEFLNTASIYYDLEGLIESIEDRLILVGSISKQRNHIKDPLGHSKEIDRSNTYTINQI